MQEINLKNLVEDNSVDEIFKQVVNEQTTLKYSEGEAEEIVKNLISKKANIEKLLSQYSPKLFSGEGKYSLLTQFHIQWAQSQDLEIDRMRRTFILKNAFANRSNENEVPADQFLGKLGTLPIDIVDGALQRPNGMSESDYIKFLSDLDVNVQGSSRKTEIAILALKNLLELEYFFAGRETTVNTTDVARYKLLKTQTQEAAKKYRKTLLGEEFAEISSLESIQQKVLEKVANNRRLRRVFVRDMMQKLYKDGKLQPEAILGAEGKDNLSKIAGLMCHLNYKDMSNFNILMSGVIDNLQSQHNLDPSIFGTANRWVNWGVSYPIGLMYYVWDCLSVVLELVLVGIQKAGYGVYDWFAGNKEDREIEFNTFSGIRDDLYKALEGIKGAKAPPEENISKESKLKNQILEFLKDPNAVDAVKTLQDKIKPDDFSGDLQVKLEALNEIKDKTALAKAVYELLQHPQMNQSVDKYLENSWGSAAKSSLVANILHK